MIRKKRLIAAIGAALIISTLTYASPGQPLETYSEEKYTFSIGGEELHVPMNMSDMTDSNWEVVSGFEKIQPHRIAEVDVARGDKELTLSVWNAADEVSDTVYGRVIGIRAREESAEDAILCGSISFGMDYDEVLHILDEGDYKYSIEEKQDITFVYVQMEEKAEGENYAYCRLSFPYDPRYKHLTMFYFQDAEEIVKWTESLK